jgi:DNA-binding transcriptional MerR regulator
LPFYARFEVTQTSDHRTKLGAPANAESSDAGSPGPGLLTTGDMARYSNNTLRTVRFYEEEGILRPARRTEGGHRLFERSELDRLMLVSDMRMAGLSLDEIKHILEVKQASATGGEAAKSAMKILASRVHELRDKLLVLTRLQRDLERTSDVMTACLDCTDSKFPSHCERCDVFTNCSDLPRSLRVLWSSTSHATNEPPEKK